MIGRKLPKAKSLQAQPASGPKAAPSSEVNLIWTRLSLQPNLPDRIQLKSEVEDPGSPLEIEADRMADTIAPGGRPANASGAQTQSGPRDVSTTDSRDPEGFAHEPGEALDTSTRHFMESRLGHSFADVRVHSASDAAETATQLSARAFTIGNRVVFARNRYEPNSISGRWLLAHELTHVVQQSEGRNLNSNHHDSPARSAMPAIGQSPPRIQRSFENTYHRVADDITSAFEGGRPGALQTADTGIISYGIHQATLASDSLYNVLVRYLQLSQSQTAQAIRPFMSRVQQHDPDLRTDQTFLNLLRQAATEPEMATAQHQVFAENYWAPAVIRAHGEGVTSALGFTIFYDTHIQGGLPALIDRTRQRLGGGIGSTVAGHTITEREYLSAFVQEREARLGRLAAARDLEAQQFGSQAAAASLRGDTAAAAALRERQREATNTANYQRTSVYRTQSFLALINAGNLDLRGGIRAHGHLVAGLTPGATIDDPDVTPTLTPGMRGRSEVAEAQRLLNQRGANPPVSITGNFGPGTLTAVRAFQRAQSPPLTDDGIVNAATWAALRRIAPAAQTAAPSPAQVVAPAAPTQNVAPPAPQVVAAPAPQVAAPSAPPDAAAPAPQVVAPPAPQMAAPSAPPDAAAPAPQVVAPPAPQVAAPSAPPDAAAPAPQVVAPPAAQVAAPPAPPDAAAPAPQVVAAPSAPSGAPPPPQTARPSPALTPPWNAAITMPTLQQGAESSQVAELQRLLNTHGASPALPTNGRFGPLTHQQVIAFQSTRTPPLPANGIVDARTWAALRQAPAPGTAAPAAIAPIPQAIANLHLMPNAQRAALTLWQQDPRVVFTDGLRSIAGHAHALAVNIVRGGGRNWIAVTYAAGPSTLLQNWVTQHPEARTVADLERGLLSVLQAMPTHVLGRVSRHFTGEAFDIQPNSIDIRLIRALPGLTQFLEREGNLVRWHVVVAE